MVTLYVIINELAISFMMCGFPTTRRRILGAAGILLDLGLLFGIQSRGRANDEAPGLQGMLPNVGLSLLGKQIPEDRGGVFNFASPTPLTARRCLSATNDAFPGRMIATERP
jgi:hypothetical protein